jgi:hypothetical protein
MTENPAAQKTKTKKTEQVQCSLDLPTPHPTFFAIYSTPS